jgi:plastocyanin
MRLRIATLVAALALLGLPATAPAQTGTTVHIKNYTFVPASLTVVAGTTVTFVNDDDEPHTATARDKSFDSEAIDTNGSWQHTFTKPGTYAYFCEMHPYMKGTLVVRAAK